MDEGQIFTKLPCLSGSCLDHRADRCRQRLGEFYLKSLAGEKTAVPPLAEVLANCCRNEFPTVTFSKPSHRGRSPPLAWDKMNAK
jgi:hypothetical protein